jgi:hypothetical protein
VAGPGPAPIFDLLVVLVVGKETFPPLFLEAFPLENLAFFDFEFILFLFKIYLLNFSVSN